MKVGFSLCRYQCHLHAPQVSSDAEAIDLMNDSPYGLTASIWTKLESQDVFNKIASEIETGTVFLNKFVPRSNVSIPLCTAHTCTDVIQLTQPSRGLASRTVDAV